MKIGRNDSCPCGSGKKYKKCCIDNSFALIPKPIPHTTARNGHFEKYLKRHNGKDLLNIIISIQTIPENYGKNVRIELIAKEIVKNLGEGDFVSLPAFRELVHKEFPYHHLEDPPEELFTENVAFFGGNYMVTQGITTNGADILRALIQGIFLNENALTDKFKEVVHDSIKWILELGDIIFKRANLQRYAFEESENNDIKFTQFIADNSFRPEWLEYFARRHHISLDILNEFVLSTDADLNDENADNNPLLKTPFVWHNNELFFVLPSAQMTALNEFIIAKAKEFGCETELLFEYNKVIYLQARERVYKMGWRRLFISLPENKHNISLKEGVYLIDYNKLAYVCFTEATLMGTYGSIETVQQHDLKYMHKHIKRLDERTEEVISFLNKEKPGYEILTLLLGNHIGRPLAIGINLGKTGNERMAFPVFDFIRLVDIEKWDMLSIWKFAKVYRIDSERTQITSTSVVDTYSLYKDNHESFFNLDNQHFDTIHIAVGSGAGLIRDSIREEDFHIVAGYYEGGLVYHFVKRALSMAPIYKPMNSNGIERVLEAFSFPLWVVNNQADDSVFDEFKLTFINAITFWMLKLCHKVQFLNKLNNAPIYVEIVIDEHFFTNIPLPEVIKEPIFEVSIKERKITFKIPFSLSNKLLSSDNSAERLMMKSLLLAFNGFEEIHTTVEEVDAAINSSIPLGQAKMILYLHTKTDIRLDPRWLPSNRYISNAESSLVFQELPKLLPYTVPNKITDRKEKIKVCNDIVSLLIKKIRQKLSEFDTEGLLKHLIIIHEGYIREREFRRIHLPAQIACYSDIQQKVDELLKKNKQLVNSTLSARCLIEFIAAESPHGGKESNYDEIDQMMAMMNEVVNYGFLSDAIFFNIEDPDMGKTASGAIIITNSFYEEKLKPFNEAKTYTEIQSYVDDFSYHFEMDSEEEKRQNTPFGDKINLAFTKDWGISFSGIMGICISLSMIAERNESSVAYMQPEELVVELLNLTTLTEDEIRYGLDKLTLTQRPDFNKPPKGYHSNDIFPWKYNREFSFLRRPLILLTGENGKQTYYWGLRNSFSANNQIQSLLYSGRIKTYNHPNIDALLGEINTRNGKRFRNDVMKWLKQQPNFATIENEISIKPGGHINAEKDYGDIDVLAFDEVNKIIYLLECKDTEQAKNIHEMRNELDKYLGKGANGGLIDKHVERDKFIQKNREKMEKLVSNIEQYKIISVIITSEDLPLSYIEDKLPLPFVSFPMLKRNGVGQLPI